MKTQKIKISDIKTNPDNPRVIRDEHYKKLVKSITEFPQMLELRPLVVDENLMVLGGNMRLRAAKEAGMKELPVLKASELTDEQKNRFIIADNLSFGEWDFDKLANEWDAEELNDWGLDVPVESEEKTDYELNNINNILGIYIEIETEFQQKQIYEELTKRGIKCKML